LSEVSLENGLFATPHAPIRAGEPLVNSQSSDSSRKACAKCPSTNQKHAIDGRARRPQTACLNWGCVTGGPAGPGTMHVESSDTETTPCPVVTVRKLYRLAATASSGRLSAIVATIGFACASFIHSDPHNYPRPTRILTILNISKLSPISTPLHCRYSAFP